MITPYCPYAFSISGTTALSSLHYHRYQGKELLALNLLDPAKSLYSACEPIIKVFVFFIDVLAYQPIENQKHFRNVTLQMWQYIWVIVHLDKKYSP